MADVRKAPPDYHQILVTETAASSVPKERSRAAADLVECVRLREKYVYARATPEADDEVLQAFQRSVREEPFAVVQPPDGKASSSGFTFEMDPVTGIFAVRSGEADASIAPPFTLAEFNRDVANVWRVATGKITRSFAFRRLRMLDVNFEFHTLMNETLELDSTRDDRADFESVTKVDNHIHAAGGFTRAELLNFIKRKAENDGDRIVTSDGKTLIQALEESGIDNPKDITIDKLDVAATASMFHRFDNFNDSYNPFGAKDLRTIFMTSKNVNDGLYFAELIRDVLFARVQAQGNRVAIEPRLSIYGRGGFAEWKALAKWVLDHKVLDVRRDGGSGASKTDDHGGDGQLTGHVKWMIQLPRLCNIFMGKSYDNFAGLMNNIFEPMFAATLDPEAHPEIYTFLNHVSGIDCVDDESNHDPLLIPGSARDTPAAEWTHKSNPPYSYWCYHVWANLYTLNRLREARGLNTFTFKPHGGESGPRHHLATCYLLADSVNHGWRLDLEPTLQYLYYLSQIGLGLCPLSNDALFIQIKESPVGKLHKRGLRVCLGTDDPLQFHNTATPLLEEYTVSGHFFEVRFSFSFSFLFPFSYFALCLLFCSVKKMGEPHAIQCLSTKHSSRVLIRVRLLATRCSRQGLTTTGKRNGWETVIRKRTWSTQTTRTTPILVISAPVFATQI